MLIALIKNKVRPVRTALALQVLITLMVIILCAIMGLSYTRDLLSMFGLVSSRPILAAIWPYYIVLLVMLATDLAFAGYSIWQFYRVNVSATYRLLPISESKLFLTNWLASMVSCGVIYVIQIAVLVIIRWFFMTPTAVHELATNTAWSPIRQNQLLEMLLLSLMMSAVYFFSSWLIFLRDWIGNRLSFGRQALSRWVTEGILAVLGLNLLYRFDELLEHLVSNVNALIYSGFWMLVLATSIFFELLFIDLLLLAIDLWLFTKTYETRQDN